MNYSGTSFEKMFLNNINQMSSISGESTGYNYLLNKKWSDSEFPSLKWPLNASSIRSVTYHNETGPGIIIVTSHHSNTTIRAPT